MDKLRFFQSVIGMNIGLLKNLSKQTYKIYLRKTQQAHRSTLIQRLFYKHATTNLAICSNETSQDKLSEA